MKLLQHNNPGKSRAGFSLAETVVAMGMTALVTASVLAGISNGFSALDSTRQELRATQILQERTETIRLYNWDEINTPGFVPSQFTAPYNPMSSGDGLIYRGTVTITNAPFAESYSANLRQVTVQLDWTSGKTPHTRKISTLVARDGIQDYVY
jgi:type II secretory pathway pseudopilin PulG